MKKLFFILTLCILIPHSSFSQNCKPDITSKDRFSGLENNSWFVDVYESPFLNVSSTSDVTITVGIGTLDSASYIQVEIRKLESSMESAQLESKMIADDKTLIQLGFKKGGSLKGTPDIFSNNTKMDKILNRLVTSIILKMNIENKDLQYFKKQLLEKGIADAIRITFKDGVILEKEIKVKKGESLLNKFSCFFQFLEQKAKN